MAWPLNHIATIDLRAASVGNYKWANIRGHAPATALGSSVLSLWEFFPAGRPILPGIQPRPPCQRGTRSNFSAVVGTHFANMVTAAGKINEASMPNWRFVQVFRPRRVLCLCVVNCGGKIIVETPQ